MDCLVTKLKGTVTSDFLKFGEVRFALRNKSTGVSKMTIYVNATTRLTIIGSGNFTDSAGSANTGNIKDLVYGVNTVYFSSDVTLISCNNKYALTGLGDLTAPFITGSTTLAGSLSDYDFITNLKELNFTSQGISGDIAVLKNVKSMTALITQYASGINGDISALSKHTALQYAYMQYSGVSGDLASLMNMTSLGQLDVSGTKISGDISSLANTNIGGALGLDMLSSIFGDLSKLTKTRYISNIEGNSAFTWTAKGARTNILFCNNIKITSGADQFLIDMANCNFSPVSSSEIYKTISIRANITAASNSAITTLQNKGVTVIVTPLT